MDLCMKKKVLFVLFDQQRKTFFLPYLYKDYGSVRTL